MMELGAHACTDVTGFGLLGHARNVVSNQRAEVSFRIDKLPIFAGLAAVDTACLNGGMFKLQQGFSAETSGGLLIAMPAESATVFCGRLEDVDGWSAFTIGTVVVGPREVRLDDEVAVIEVE
eukprot:Plantae.Rhodophyta-Rhodochaete_pulchella.ctg9788.p1 GENE.Plantae.Rhodophyta-Rhodochaete_pulchella.ctg9788~~Plantae.Rhodophyta-Rhodochaete_pulchella.ctg9788.p1  ORF type:complete len:136 (-),score=20.03 Plantae.Rhodophyta-Rhodochaete_pulchella.ctg9788:309-674(-)